MSYKFYLYFTFLFLKYIKQYTVIMENASVKHVMKNLSVILTREPLIELKHKNTEIMESLYTKHNCMNKLSKPNNRRTLQGLYANGIIRRKQCGKELPYSKQTNEERKECRVILERLNTHKLEQVLQEISPKNANSVCKDPLTKLCYEKYTSQPFEKIPVYNRTGDSGKENNDLYEFDESDTIEDTNQAQRDLQKRKVKHTSRVRKKKRKTDKCRVRKNKICITYDETVRDILQKIMTKVNKGKLGLQISAPIQQEMDKFNLHISNPVRQKIDTFDLQTSTPIRQKSDKLCPQNSTPFRQENTKLDVQMSSPIRQKMDKLDLQISTSIRQESDKLDHQTSTPSRQRSGALDLQTSTLFRRETDKLDVQTSTPIRQKSGRLDIQTSTPFRQETDKLVVEISSTIWQKTDALNLQTSTPIRQETNKLHYQTSPPIRLETHFESNVHSPIQECNLSEMSDDNGGYELHDDELEDNILENNKQNDTFSNNRVILRSLYIPLKRIKKINIISDIWLDEIDHPSFLNQNLQSNADSTLLRKRSYPWRFDENLRRNPHYLHIKKSALPSLQQDMIIDYNQLMKLEKHFAKIPRRFKTSKNKSKRLREPEYCQVKLNKENIPRMSLFEDDIVSDTQPKLILDNLSVDKQKRNILGPIVQNTNNITKVPKSNMVQTDALPQEVLKPSNKTVNVNAPQKNVNPADKSLEPRLFQDDESSFCVNENSKIYIPKRRKKKPLLYHNAGELNQDKHKREMTRAEEAELNEWAAKFNSLCEDIEKYQLEIE